MFKRSFAFAALALAFTVAPWAAAPLSAQSQETVVSEAQSENILVLKLKDGDVVIRTRPDLAPNHVARITELASQGFYDGIVFHRVIPGFMAQTGDPTGTGTGGSGRKLRAEFSSAPFKRGTLGMARSASPDSGDSQFFICFDDAPHLNGQYTVWGEVISGMEFVDKIKKGAGGGGTVSDPDKMISLRPQAAN
ncbi:peptidylprolyl isomerase [Neomegalonema perideroedes]|uniref:peptidylprolyl isomerase n=1 Tax=Neomegalonema perideroedes TaxID=217219 RepID=UPI00036E0C10|nr:peptidylprolyl isomerase [Neomegalonema perideroedes]